MLNKHLTKSQYPFMIKKNLIKLGIEGNFLKLIKNMYKNPTANIILNGEKVDAFLLI